MTRSTPRRWSRVVHLIAALLVVGAIAVPSVTDARADTPPAPWSVTATPTQQVVDGQKIAITIKSSADYVLNTAVVAVCRPGVTYTVKSDIAPATGNCPAGGISTSGGASLQKAIALTSPTADGAAIRYPVGTGVAQWYAAAAGGVVSLTCDETHPCLLVVQVIGGPNAAVSYWTSELTFRPDDIIAGCGGPANGILATGGSDRMSNAWVAWTLAACKRPGASGAPSRASFSGEGASVESFATGGLDMAYTGAGYNHSVGLATGDHRPAVAVPLAVNATVLAVGNGYLNVYGEKVPYGEVKLTLDEVTLLLAGGFSVLERPEHLNPILARNPQLAASSFHEVEIGHPLAAAEPESTSWFMTNHLHQLRPGLWAVPPLSNLFGANAGKSRGVDASLALADPGYLGAIDTFSGRAAAQKLLDPIANGPQPGGTWMLTDLATAEELGMTPVSIENASGQFVAPTAASIAAALPTMTPDADGVLLPNPTASAAPGQVRPYPLTYVEYALAPTEPLLDDACAPRAASQALLTSWLTYLTGAGQKLLPAGLAPLPPTLASQAAAAIPKLGTAPVTGPCKPAEPTTTTTITTPATTPSAAVPDGGSFDTSGIPGGGFDASGGFDSGGTIGGEGTGAGTDASGGATTSAASGGGAATLGSSSGGAPATPSATPSVPPSSTKPGDPPADAVIDIPGFAGSRSPSGFVTIGALIAIIALAVAAAFVSSGRVGRSVPQDEHRFETIELPR